MVVAIKKKRTSPRSRPGLLQPADSVSSMRSTTERSSSAADLKAAHQSSCSKPSVVSFALDYNCRNTVHLPAWPPMEDEEIKASFYNVRRRRTKSICPFNASTRQKFPKTLLTPSFQSNKKASDLNQFDTSFKDRALTVLMYRTRKNNGVPWEDDVHSLRGLEDLTDQRKTEKPRRTKRQEYVRAVLDEQARLKSPEGQNELNAASRAIHKPPEELLAELLRGVSCSLSKADKHRALALGMKDQRASGVSRHGSARKLMKQVTSRLYGWASTSTKSLGSCSERSGSELAADEENKNKTNKKDAPPSP